MLSSIDMRSEKNNLINDDPFKRTGINRVIGIFWILVKDLIQNLRWYILSKLTGHKLVFIIGDSHTRPFRGGKWFMIFHIGAATAYNLSKERSSTNSNRKFWSAVRIMNKKKDKAILVFGEIDCRIHIYNQHKKSGGKKSISDVIDSTINSYGKILCDLRGRGYKFFVFGVPPASTQGNIYEYTYYAPAKIRALINNEFNGRLKKYCEANGLIYMDIYSKTVDKKGFIKSEFAADDIHLNSKIQKYVVEWLEEYEG